MDGLLRFIERFREVSLRGIGTGENGLSFSVLWLSLQYGLSAVSCLGNLSGCKQQICQIQLSFKILRTNLHSAYQFLIRVTPVVLLQVRLREFVVRLRKFGVKLKGILKFDARFAVFALLKVCVAPVEVLLL